MQHERKPIVDRKQDAHKNSGSDNQDMSVQGKSRQKKMMSNESMNYLSLFQLNPSILMQAAANVTSAQSSMQQNSPPSKASELLGVKLEEEEDFYENKANNQETSELFESAQDQKLLNSAFELINLIESSLQSNQETKNDNFDEKISFSYISKLEDENANQFKIQLPQILLPKMHYVCEIGSRILFKTIDWLRTLSVWNNFEDDGQCQSTMLQANWAELLIIGLTQVLLTSSDSLQLKSVIISTLVNYVKSLIIYSANESHQIKLGGAKGDFKASSGHKIKKMLNNIALINKFIDEASLLRKFSDSFFFKFIGSNWL